ncbi:hypothetical protein A3195_10295 [Candidatus Thiodiazotropha endoloripes]|uniref:DUF6683 family protein n=1 Tax=Candidatus Thiodiazotropha endoloripes TaxID=1818881 RepID=UPI00083CF723|nr:DUF6683 family protein [Candidatus Thiodiazotropha endoloripes]ODB86044.1 hypothetical protein A3195_10295 [Candidatus Thiodiazotropha endoloripes]ODB88077.1 hypothetical protein A3193_04110 [Candidatus Thiodiazotropha endoloripes]
MNIRLLLSRLLLAGFLSTCSTMINSAPVNRTAATPGFLVDGFDQLFEQPVMAPTIRPLESSGEAGKRFVEQLSTITPQDIQAAANNKSLSAVQLAGNFPEANRANMEKLFNIALFVQKRIEQAARAPEGDIPTATASFLYGIWSAYNEGAEIPEQNLLHLHKQVEQMIASNQALSQGLENASPADRQKLYEYLAMTGNWMVMFQDTFKKGPDQKVVTNIKNIARELLQASFKIDVEKLRISQDGQLSML